MIRLTCPTCGSALTAKDELAGEVRNCPKCGSPVRILQPREPAELTLPQGAAQSAPPPPSPTPPPVGDAGPPGLPVHHWPDRLNRQHHYLICDKSKVVATWENNGKGWLLCTHTGLVSAARNRDEIPTAGEYTLVELRIEPTGQGRRLVGIKPYQLGSRWALTCLDKGDDPIMGKITGLAGLNRDQKNAVRRSLKEQFMPDVWQDAGKVLEYLANADYRSPGTD